MLRSLSSAVAVLGLSLPAPVAAEDIRPPPLAGGAIGAQDAPSAVFDGRAFAVVWQDRRSSSLNERPAIRVAGLSVEGDLLDDPARLIGDTWPNIHAFPQAAHCFGRLVTVWQDGYEVRVQLVRDGQEHAAEPLRVPATQGFPPLPSIACSETQALVVWRAEARGEIRGLWLGLMGPLEPQSFRISRDDQQSGTDQPRVATDGQGFLVVHQFGEQGVNAYRKADGKPSEGYRQLDALVSQLTGRAIAAFAGAERAERLVVSAGAERTN